jgi:uncharacterized protein YdeI (YjbR/CyaY-like superfamily)
MPKKHSFTGVIQNASGANGGGAFVEIPAELKKALSKDAEAKAIFDKLSASHQKEYVTWINEAKREETRQARIVKTIAMLKKSRKGR